MKSLPQQILIGVTGCITLTLVFGYSLSIAVNYGISKFEEQADDFLPGTSPDVQTAPMP
jgi:hypothetical protein